MGAVIFSKTFVPI